MRHYFNDVENLYDEQAEMKQTLERIKTMNCSDTAAFKAAVDLLATAVNEHVKEEEEQMFPRIRSTFGDEQQKKMAADFLTVKSKIQDQWLASASR